MIKKLFNWIFKAELDKLNSEISKAKNIAHRLEDKEKVFKTILSNIDVSVDVHEYDHKYSPSWAVISLQGTKTDYIKFVNLGDSDIHDIARYLRHFERSYSNIKIDASPMGSEFLRIQRIKHV